MRPSRFNPRVPNIWSSTDRNPKENYAGQWGLMGATFFCCMWGALNLLATFGDSGLGHVLAAGSPILLATAITVVWKLRRGARPWEGFSLQALLLVPLAVYGFFSLSGVPEDVDPDRAERARRLLMPFVAFWVAFALPPEHIFESREGADDHVGPE